VTDQPRYQELARRYGPVVADSGTCSCHVHVGVPSRDLGVQVLARLRPWLAPLLAITANSPIAGGSETGWASWRYPLWSRWPTAAPPAVWGSAVAYDAAVRHLIARGAALDERSVYILARLSPRYPTVEGRLPPSPWRRPGPRPLGRTAGRKWFDTLNDIVTAGPSRSGADVFCRSSRHRFFPRRSVAR
jgi:gamma-glutamyl:cysteine ligase YbdK (ATP-grasp superfamily)